MSSPVSRPESTPVQESSARVVSALNALNTSSDLLRAMLAVELRIAPVDVRALFIVATDRDLTPTEVGRRLGLTTGSLTALVDRLEAKGFLRREKHETDRRSVVLHVTPAGDHARLWASERYLDAVQSVLAESTLDGDQVAGLLLALKDRLDATTTDLVRG